MGSIWDRSELKLDWLDVDFISMSFILEKSAETSVELRVLRINSIQQAITIVLDSAILFNIRNRGYPAQNFST